ncbi:carbohydrate-binding protein [Paenibacillus sp. FSL H8-0548]|nr:carbohydrate-binding protein [Paenibacillus sp. FSL H8-0548]
MLVCALLFQVAFCSLLVAKADAVTPTDLEMVSRVTGVKPAGETMPNPNQTDTNYQISGTDLGIVWDKGGGQYFVLFGDTNGLGPNDWRSNTLAISSDTNLSDGLSFDTMVQDRPGHAKEILYSKKIDFDEITVIPTAGVTVGTRHYIHYMSVNHWGDAGVWQTNYSGIAYSDNNGATWTKHPTARWYNNTTTWDNKFQMAAFIKDSGFIYMYATPNGRFGDVYLARVPENSLLSINEYRYWDGNGWSVGQSSARPVANGVAGELSVAYNSHFNRYIMTYLNEHRQAIVMRDAPTPVGPWSGEKILVPGNFTGLGQYNAFIHPLSNTSSTLYFIMSTWYPDYNTHLMKVTLTADIFGDNIVSDPGFESQGQTKVMAPWHTIGEGGIDRNAGNARTGQDNGYIRNGSGWNAIKQRVVVEPFTNYTLKGWIRTSGNNNDGYFGARVPNGGMILGEAPFDSYADYTELTVSFNSGANHFVELYTGMWADEDTWVQVDDVSLNRDANLVAHAGFEAQPSSTITSPWYLNGNGGIDRAAGFARSGLNNAFARYGTGWNAVKQEVFVEQNTNYTLSAWIRTSTNQNNGYFGARLLGGGTILNETPFGYLSDYTKKTVQFNSGNAHSVEIYAGMWANGGDTWIQADDFSLTKN